MKRLFPGEYNGCSIDQDYERSKHYFMDTFLTKETPMLPKVFIIILNWNGLEDTLECLSSLSQLNYPNFDVLVVDNGSEEEGLESINKAFPDVKSIRNDVNLGYSGGNNVGIRYAIEQGADYVWILNNDTLVDPDALLHLILESEKSSEIGIAGSLIYYWGSPKRIWFAGSQIDWLKGSSDHIGMGEIDTGQYETVKEVDRVTGCSMIVKKEVCLNVGLLDEDYYLYVEEVDWCVRTKKNGFKCILVPSSVVYHKASISVSKIGLWNKVFGYYNTRNFLFLIKKSFSFPIREFLLVSMIVRKLKYEKRNSVKMLLTLISPSFKLEPKKSPILFAVKDFLTGKMGKSDYSF